MKIVKHIVAFRAEIVSKRNLRIECVAGRQACIAVPDVHHCCQERSAMANQSGSAIIRHLHAVGYH